MSASRSPPPGRTQPRRVLNDDDNFFGEEGEPDAVVTIATIDSQMDNQHNAQTSRLCIRIFDGISPALVKTRRSRLLSNILTPTRQKRPPLLLWGHYHHLRCGRSPPPPHLRLNLPLRRNFIADVSVVRTKTLESHLV